MNRLLYRASGYDVVNLWMNLAKVLVVFLFIYQDTLFSQLGLNMFLKQHYVFHEMQTPSSIEPGPGGANAQSITTENPNFRIQFLPLTIVKRYDNVRVEILGVKQDEKALTLRTGAKLHEEYPWPMSNHGETSPMHQTMFNLREIVDDTLSSGAYKVRFGFKFFRGGEVQAQEGYEDGASEELLDHTLTLNYEQTGIEHFGYYPVVRGRSFEVPPSLRPLQISWTDSRSRRTGTNDAWTDWQASPILRRDQARLSAQNVSPGRTYEQRGFYEDAKKNKHHFDLSLIVSENLPPRATYLGPNGGRANKVAIYSDWLFMSPNGVQYFNLSRDIIDPDGIDTSGRSDVRVRSIADLQPSTDFALRRATDGTGDFWLVPSRNLNVILPAIGARRTFTVTAADEANRELITIELTRIK